MKFIAHFFLWILTLFLTLSAFAFLPRPAGFLSLLLIAVIIPLEEWQSFLGKYTRRWLRPLVAAALSLVLFFSGSVSFLPVTPADPVGADTSHSIEETAKDILQSSAVVEGVGSVLQSGTTVENTDDPVDNFIAPGDGTLVWIPTRGGIKYHTHAECSDMIGPIQVSVSTAIDRGFDACKKCYN